MSFLYEFAMVGRRPPKKETIVSSPQAPTPDTPRDWWTQDATPDVEELRRLAEIAVVASGPGGGDDNARDYVAFTDACDPTTILSLLDEIERLRSALEDVKTLARQSAPPIGDGTEDVEPWFGFWTIANAALAPTSDKTKGGAG